MVPLVQEDGAPAHRHSHQASVFALEGVSRLLWPGNSPDLNAIEPAWFWMKQRTTSLGATTSRLEMEKRWYKAWRDLPQDVVQSWVERVPHHIQEIIRLEGGNEYAEGIAGFQRRSWKGDRIKGKLSPRATIDPELSTYVRSKRQHRSPPREPQPQPWPEEKARQSVRITRGRAKLQKAQDQESESDGEVNSSDDDDDDDCWASDATERYDREHEIRSHTE